MTGQAGVAVRVLATRVVDAVMHRGRSLKAELAANLPRVEDARDRALLERGSASGALTQCHRSA